MYVKNALKRRCYYSLTAWLATDYGATSEATEIEQHVINLSFADFIASATGRRSCFHPRYFVYLLAE